MREPSTGVQLGSGRLRRAHSSLRVAFFVHCTLIVYVAFSVSSGSIRPVADAVAATALAVTPLAVLLWRERRSPAVGRPSRWVTRGLATVPGHAVGVGVGMAVAGVLAPAGMTMWTAVTVIAAAVSVGELLPAALASRALRRPLSADLGELDIEVQVEIRSTMNGLPSWLAQDDVRLTDSSLIMTVRPGPARAYAKSIVLAEIRDVEIRRTDERDGPWFPVVDDYLLWPPPGDVVVIHHGEGVQILPVYEPAGFAAVLEARVARLGSAN
jgi:hypothetical protein